MEQIELLAPCGNYECFLAAVNAGADAVYLAGDKFGARAYSDNFTTVELINLIHEAHLHAVKVYLTVNTLLKQTEIKELKEWFFPLYQAGVDGVIIQDLGVMHLVKQEFPDLEIHISTQMSITSHYGVALAHEYGACRIVPARELSIEEIKNLRKDQKIEIETFIHGAMCYCYSGQCLMSSFIGGRSGNRGRCAQPCRLPYQINKKEKYFLSLKDMNALEDLPIIIEAGVNSLKIEGRMKKPEYVAGVTSIYRKYIDIYWRDPQRFKINQEDLLLLNKLYIRSETGDGYYHKNRGKDMLTLDRPGYNGTDEETLQDLHVKYVHKLEPVPLKLNITCKLNDVLQLSCLWKNQTIRIEGPVVLPAKQHAATRADFENKLCKMGNTPFLVDSFEINLEDGCFIPVKWLSEMKQELLNQLYTKSGERISVHKTPEEPLGFMDENLLIENKQADSNTLSISVMTKEQLRIAFKYIEKLESLYIDSDLLYDIMIHREIEENKEILKILKNINAVCLLFCVLPTIIRDKDEIFLQKIHSFITDLSFTGYVCKTIDGLGFAKAQKDSFFHIADASLYHWNIHAMIQTQKDVCRYTVPLEYNSNEIRKLCQDISKKSLSKLEVVVYGRAPLMVSSNCVRLTTDQCLKKNELKNKNTWTEITDRKKIHFPVYTNCSHCYNIIYNSVPTSLHDYIWMLQEDGIKHYRIELTVEDDNNSEKIIKTYQYLLNTKRESNTKDQNSNKIIQETTGGHFRRGVE